MSVPLQGNTLTEGVVQPIAEYNLQTDKDEDGIHFPKDSVFELPNAHLFINPDGGALSLEVKPEWNGTDPGDNSFVQVKDSGSWQGEMMLYRNGTGLRFIWFDSNGQEHGVTADVSRWVAGEPHVVTTTWGQAQLSIYVDGKLAEQTTYAGDLHVTPGVPLFLGSNPRHHIPGADSSLQNFKVYGHTLTPEEIANN